MYIKLNTHYLTYCEAVCIVTHLIYENMCDFIWEKHRNNLLKSHYRPRHRDVSSTLIYALIEVQTAPPCGPADTEDCAFCVQGITSKMALNWCRWDATVIVEYSHYFCFISVQTVFSSLHSGQIEPPMAAGVPWRCFSYFPGPWQCNLLGSYMAVQ